MSKVISILKSLKKTVSLYYPRTLEWKTIALIKSDQIIVIAELNAYSGLLEHSTAFSRR